MRDNSKPVLDGQDLKKYTRREVVKGGAVAGAALAFAPLLSACGGSSPSSSASSAGGKKFLVYNALSYSGNAWANGAANIIHALANTPPYDKTVELRKIISGSDITKQLSDLQSMIAEGADAIICYPLSPTALNGVIEQAAEKGCKMFFYDGTVTSPEGYNVSYLASGFGQNTAQYLVNCLGGKGKIFMNGGVAGTATDTMHIKAAKEVFKKYPDIEIVASFWSNWDAVQSKTNTLKALAAHPDVDGIWSEDGEYGCVQALQQANHKWIPVTGEHANGFRHQLLNYGPKGLLGVSSGSSPTVGGYAFKLAMELLTGATSEKEMPHNIKMILPWFPWNKIEVGDPYKPAEGGNCWPLAQVPATTPGGIFFPELVPEINYHSVFDGTPVPGQTIQKIAPDVIEKALDVPGVNSSATTTPPELYDIDETLEGVGIPGGGVTPVPAPA
jgi:ribose transport system substrate-binding protein